jgi:hypothetical protein
MIDANEAVASETLPRSLEKKALLRQEQLVASKMYLGS